MIARFRSRIQHGSELRFEPRYPRGWLGLLVDRAQLAVQLLALGDRDGVHGRELVRLLLDGARRLVEDRERPSTLYSSVMACNPALGLVHLVDGTSGGHREQRLPAARRR